jgi:hypothetical protein
LTLELTLQEAQIWKGIQSGELMYRGYARSSKFIEKDRKIAEMLEKGCKHFKISEELSTSYRRIDRVKKECGLL